MLQYVRDVPKKIPKLCLYIDAIPNNIIVSVNDFPARYIDDSLRLVAGLERKTPGSNCNMWKSLLFKIRFAIIFFFYRFRFLLYFYIDELKISRALKLKYKRRHWKKKNKILQLACIIIQLL